MTAGASIRFGFVLEAFGAIAVAAAILASSIVVAQDAMPVFTGIRVYGTDRLDQESLRTELADEIEQLIAAGAEFDEARLEEISGRIEQQLLAREPFAFISAVVGMSFGPEGSTIGLFVNAVEEADRARRMPFRASPTGQYADPDALLALWKEYEDRSIRLMMSGALREYAFRCPVLHCLTSFEHPDLAPYLAVFNEGALEHQALLQEIAEYDRDPVHRASALLLLAHRDDAGRLLRSLNNAIYDPDADVRNYAMRIMWMIAEKEPEREYSIRGLIAALDFPVPSDRQKAILTLAQLVKVPKHAAIIEDEGLPNVLRLLRTSGGDMRNSAHQILRTLSGEAFAIDDYAAWEAWVDG